LVEAAEYFRDITGRQVTFEYVLLGGINDRPEHAVELGKLLRRQGAFVNLIPFNPVPRSAFQTPASDDSGASRKFSSAGHSGEDPQTQRFGRQRRLRPASAFSRRRPQLLELESAARIEA